MRIRPWSSVTIAIALFASAGAFLGWSTHSRMQRVEFLTGLPVWSVDQPSLDDGSPTGYANQVRWQIVPGRNHASFEWIIQAQSSLESGSWRVRHVDYDNAPHGRPTQKAAPYRWWIQVLAWADHTIRGGAIGRSVERAALVADPLLHAMFLLAVVGLAAVRLGPMAAAIMGVGAVTLFPFAGEFLPGAPDQRGLSLALVATANLLLLAGILGPRASPLSSNPASATHAMGAPPSRWPWFAVAGALSGFGLWLDARLQLPLIAGTACGALLWPLWRRCTSSHHRGPSDPVLPWRAWAVAGAGTSLAGYAAEYAPESLTFALEVNHPVHALAWLGTGEALRWFTRLRADPAPGSRVRRGCLAATALAAMALPLAVPVLIARSGPGWTDPFASQLSRLLPVAAENTGAWFARDGLSLPLVATLVSVVVVGGTVGLLLRRTTATAAQTGLAVLLGPWLIATGIACFQLRWWAVASAAALPLLAAGAASHTRQRGPRTVAGLSATLGLLLAAAIPLWPRKGTSTALTETEALSIIERDLACWLQQRAPAGEAVILASPDLTASLCFHGGLAGIGTLYWENRDGITAVIRLATSASREETLALLQARQVTHIILPSWDPLLAEYARLGSQTPDKTFLAALETWALPSWLRAIPYRIPAMAGLGDPQAVVLEVTEEFDTITATSRLAEYFVETGRRESAEIMAQRLQQYPASLDALTARARVAAARTDRAEMIHVMDTLVAQLAGNRDEFLAWDRRVSLAIVLMNENQPTLAARQVKSCLDTASAADLRFLTTESLYRLLVMRKILALEFADPSLAALAQARLPGDLRARLP